MESCNCWSEPVIVSWAVVLLRRHQPYWSTRARVWAWILPFAVFRMLQSATLLITPRNRPISHHMLCCIPLPFRNCRVNPLNRKSVREGKQNEKCNFYHHTRHLCFWIKKKFFFLNKMQTLAKWTTDKHMDWKMTYFLWIVIWRKRWVVTLFYLLTQRVQIHFVTIERTL